MKDATKFLKEYKNYVEKKEIKEVTIAAKMNFVNKLFKFIDESIGEISELDRNTVYEFVNQTNYASMTKSILQFTLRDFFNFTFDEKYTLFSGNQLYPIVFTNKRSTIISCYSQKEISEMINAMNPLVKCYVRDKCMVLIAAQTGFRESDIVWLKFSEIQWDKQLISKIQYKTKLPVTVSFSDDVKFLLIDYIKNYRNTTEKEYIFINTYTSMPFKTADVLTHIIQKNFKKSKVQIGTRRFGAHTLRHSMATNMLKENTPLPIIKDVLGHSCVTTTERYISVDVEGLRLVSLEVPNEYK